MPQETLDLKGLGHKEKEEKIFPALDKLEVGGSIKLIFDFNPVPLVYMLKAREEFELSFEREGPQEWILNVKRTKPKKDHRQDFKDLLKELKEKEVSQEAKEKAKKIFQALDAKTLGLVEQELIQEGVSHEEIRKSLCDIHLEALRDTLVKKRIEVEAPHPVHTFMEEHKVILNSLNELDALIKRLKDKNSFEDMGDDLEKLKDIAHHLVEAESHHQREEDVLFPKLESHGIKEPAEIMRMDHIEFRERKKKLYQYAQNWEDYPFDEFKSTVIQLGEYLTQELESHIFKEDNILYQIALQTLDEKEWDEVKRECDKIGYCCFTPQDQQERQEKIVELDLKPLPPFQRHEKIFQEWDKLKEGQAIRIINDHDPKPLWYQFEVEYKGKYNWQYEQKGPRDWIVKIEKVKRGD